MNCENITNSGEKCKTRFIFNEGENKIECTKYCFDKNIDDFCHTLIYAPTNVKLTDEEGKKHNESIDALHSIELKSMFKLEGINDNITIIYNLIKLKNPPENLPKYSPNKWNFHLTFEFTSNKYNRFSKDLYYLKINSDNAKKILKLLFLSLKGGVLINIHLDSENEIEYDVKKASFPTYPKGIYIKNTWNVNDNGLETSFTFEIHDSPKNSIRNTINLIENLINGEAIIEKNDDDLDYFLSTDRKIVQKVCSEKDDLLGDKLFDSETTTFIEGKHAECLSFNDLGEMLEKASKVYLWESGPLKYAPVFKLPYTGKWIQSTKELLISFTTYKVELIGELPIGSFFEASQLHGAIEKVYRVVPMNRSKLLQGDEEKGESFTIFKPNKEDCRFEWEKDMIVLLTQNGEFTVRNRRNGEKIVTNNKWGKDVLNSIRRNVEIVLKNKETGETISTDINTDYDILSNPPERYEENNEDEENNDEEDRNVEPEDE